MKDLERIRDLIHDLSVASASKMPSNVENHDDISLAQFVISKGGSENTLKMVRVWTRVMLGVEADDMSAQFFINYTGRGGGLKQLRSDTKHGAQFLRFRKGGSFILFLEANLIINSTYRSTVNCNQPCSSFKNPNDSPVNSSEEDYTIRRRDFRDFRKLRLLLQESRC